MKVRDKTIIESQQEAVRVNLRGRPEQSVENSEARVRPRVSPGTDRDAGVTTSVALGMPKADQIASERRQRVEELRSLYQAGKLRAAPSEEVAKKIIEDAFYDRAFFGDKVSNE